MIDMSKVVHASGNTFEEEVLKSNLPVFVDFWAEWCGPCKAIGPILEELAEEFYGKIKIVKINVDKDQQLASQFTVQAIPSLLIFKEGKEIDRMVGAADKEKYIIKLNGIIN